jgi:hypothetical protein
MVKIGKLSAKELRLTALIIQISGELSNGQIMPSQDTIPNFEKKGYCGYE